MIIYYNHFKASIECNKHQIDYYNHFRNKKGKGRERSDNDDIGSIYKAALYQRGYGPRDFDEIQGYGFWQDLWAIGKPLLTEGLKFFGAKAVDTAANVARDAIDGKNVKESTMSRLTEAKDDVIAAVPGAITGLFRKRANPNPYKGVSERRKTISQRSAGALATAARKTGGEFPALKYL